MEVLRNRIFNGPDIKRGVKRLWRSHNFGGAMWRTRELLTEVCCLPWARAHSL